MIAQDTLVRSLVNSLKVASAVAVISTIFGILAAKAVTGYDLRGKAPIVAFIIAFFLTGREATLPLFIFSQLRLSQKLPNVLALGSCILAASTIVIAVAEYLRRRNLRSGRQAGLGV